MHHPIHNVNGEMDSWLFLSVVPRHLPTIINSVDKLVLNGAGRDLH
jgi:hypothetical protein